MGSEISQTDFFNYEIDKVKEFEKKVKSDKQLDIVYLTKGQKIVL